MADDKLSFLAGPAPGEGETVTQPESAAPEITTPPAGAERDAHGRFAARPTEQPAAPETPPAVAADTPAAPATPPEPGHVPISALLDEREKRQAEKARAEKLERDLADLRAKAAPAAPAPPEEQLRAALYAQNLRTSRRFAERAHTPELVATVHDWAAARCDTDPAFNAQMRESEDPYEAAMAAYQRHQVLEAVKPADLADFQAWRAAQAAQAAGGAPPASPAAPQARAPAALPPKSLANASGSGAVGTPHVPVGPGQAFGATIR